MKNEVHWRHNATLELGQSLDSGLALENLAAAEMNYL